MSDERHTELLLELEILREILDFHAQNPEIWVGRKLEYEQHIDDILDQINHINKQLNEQ